MINNYYFLSQFNENAKFKILSLKTKTTKEAILKRWGSDGNIVINPIGKNLLHGGNYAEIIKLDQNGKPFEFLACCKYNKRDLMK